MAITSSVSPSREHAKRRYACVLSLLLGVLLMTVGCQDPTGSFPGLLSSEPSYPSVVPEGDGAWDSKMVHAPSVLKTDGGYYMWYDGTKESDLYSGWSIGVAMSQDGATWARWQSNPVLTPGPEGSWDGASVHDPRVIWDGSRFLMWYSGYDHHHWRIGLATSEDGRRWTKYENNPVLDHGPSGSWDEINVAYSSVMLKDGAYQMWYQGGDSRGVWRIGYATSQDGVRWERYNGNPVMTSTRESWDNERVFTPHVLQTKTGYLMLYTGGGLGTGSGPITGLGYALSEDGVRWRKDPRGPTLILMAGAQPVTLTALQDGDRLNVWFGEQRDGRLMIRRTATTLISGPKS